MSNHFTPAPSSLKLDKVDPGSTPGLSSEESEEILDRLRDELRDLSELLYADHKRSLLIVLHGMDASGKDGAVRWLSSGVNPMSFTVRGYKAPNEEERDHDFLWRVHKHCPPRGFVGVFNRSHYEEVATVKVHPEYLHTQHLPEEIASDSSIWKHRYRQIRDFERILAENGTVVLKFLLHVSQKEQMKRLNERMEDPKKWWKHNADDLKERKLWDEYSSAFETMIEETNTKQAPWYIVPADKKWYRNYMIGSVVTETLRKLKMKWPK